MYSERTQSEENYRVLLDAIPDVMMRLDRHGVCLDYRPAQNVRSIKAEVDWYAKPVTELLPSDLAQKQLFYLEQALVTGEMQFYEQQIQIGQELRYEEVRVVPCAADEVLVMVRDISDRKYVEKALRQSEHRFQRLAANIPGMIYQFRMEANGGCSFPYVSAFSQTLFELEPEVIQQQAGILISLIHPDDCDSFQESVLTSAATLQAWDWMGRYIMPSGKVKWVQGHSRPELQTDGAIVWDGLLIDVSERKAAEFALQQTEARYRNIFEAVSDAILIRDLKTGRLTDANPAACAIYGYSREELLSLNAADLYHPDSLPVLKKFLDAVQAGDCFAGHAVNLRKDGSFFDIEMRGSAYVDHDKIFALSTIRDVSVRKAAEEALRRSEAQLRQQAIDLEQALEQLQHTQAQLVQNEKMSSLGQLVAGIAHEINNPITFIAGNIHHARDYFQDILSILNLYEKHCSCQSPEIHATIAALDVDFIVSDFSRLLESMQSGAKRIQQIVLSLRTFSRLDEAALKTIDVHHGLESTLTILQSRINQDDRGDRIQLVKCYGELPVVECYAGQLNQVFLNILSNAIDALEEAILSDQTKKPSIEIHTEQVERSIRIRILDNGLGIPESVQSRIFDPFFTTKPVGKGTGMGLATSYQIVTEQHRGILKCHSVRGQGTEFMIEIPIDQTQH